MRKKRLRKAVFIVILTISLAYSYIHLKNERTVEMNIIRQNFITVSPNVALSKDSTLSFDLEKKNVFADYLSSAVKGSKFYYGYKHVSDEGEKEFKAAKSYLLYEYNHDYLPKRLKLYDFRDKKWKICAEYSYPYKNRRDYEKDLDESIEVILHGQ